MISSSYIKVVRTLWRFVPGCLLFLKEKKSSLGTQYAVGLGDQVSLADIEEGISYMQRQNEQVPSQGQFFFSILSAVRTYREVQSR
jgi:hypothetical protein